MSERSSTTLQSAIEQKRVLEERIRDAIMQFERQVPEIQVSNVYVVRISGKTKVKFDFEFIS